MRHVIEHELTNREWQPFVTATAEANYVQAELPSGWLESWDRLPALEWLLGFDFITDGDDLEIRRFERTIG